MKNWYSVLSLLFTLVLSGAATPACAAVSVNAITTSLKETTPKATLEKYFDCEDFQGGGYAGIATGKPEWIVVAKQMLEHSDACYTEGIQSALGRAMQNAPTNVLPLVNENNLLSADSVCLPFISDELPLQSQLAEIKKSKRALARVHSKKLERNKQACLGFIRSVEDGLKTRK